MEKKVYACYLRTKETQLKSSSGGLFTALSDSVLNNNGVVLACKYNSTNHAIEYDAAKSKEARDKLRGSKYIKAEASSLYRVLGETVNKNAKKQIMIVGTPCQIEGVKKWCDNHSINGNQIILVDLICHGVSSPNMWKKYIKSVEKRFSSKVISITFKDKEKGWLRPTAKAVLENGEKILIEDYALLYRSNNIMRDVCYKCPYSNTDRISDITIGDYWNYKALDEDFVDMDGISVAIINSKAGKELFDKSKQQLKYIESNLEDCLQPNLIEPTKRSCFYKRLNRHYKNRGIEYIIDKYVYYGPGNKLTRRIRRKIFRIVNKNNN